MLSREDVKVGDVIEVPPGVDVVCTTRYRIRVDELAAYGPYGPRVKADGSPMQSRSAQAENGLVMRVVPWNLIPKCIRHQAHQAGTTFEGVTYRVTAAGAAKCHPTPLGMRDSPTRDVT